jgi:hypothetical protein
MTSEKYGTYLTAKECKFVNSVICACGENVFASDAHGTAVLLDSVAGCMRSEAIIHEAMSSWDMGTHEVFSLIERLFKCEEPIPPCGEFIP